MSFSVRSEVLHPALDLPGGTSDADIIKQYLESPDLLHLLTHVLIAYLVFFGPPRLSTAEGGPICTQHLSFSLNTGYVQPNSLMLNIHRNAL